MGLTAGRALPKPPQASGTGPSLAVEVPRRARAVQLPHGVQGLECGISLSRVLYKHGCPSVSG